MSMNDAAMKLLDVDAAVRAAAAESLAQLGSEAQAAAVPLARACADESEEVREWATSALEGLGAPDAGDVPALIELLEDPHADIAFWAATLLGRLRSDAAAATSTLTRLSDQSPHANVRQRCTWALGRIRE